MSIVLEEARLWRYVKRTVIASPRFKPKEDDSEDQTEKFFAREKKMFEVEDNARIAVAKIEKIYLDIVQKELFSIKASKK